MVIPHGQRWNGGIAMSDVWLNDGVADRIANTTASVTHFGTAMNLMDTSISLVWGINAIPYTSYPVYLTFDFGLGNAYDITQVRIRTLPGTYPLQQLQDAPSYFRLQYSDDGSSWTNYFWGLQRTTWSLANNIASYNKPTADFSSGARYWALISGAGQDSLPPVLTEVQLRTAIGGADITTPATPVTQGISGYPSMGFGPTHMVDNNPYTHWSSTYYEDFLAFDLSSAQDVREMLLQASQTATM